MPKKDIKITTETRENLEDQNSVPGKYKNRKITNNWSKYVETDSETPIDNLEDDFNNLVLSSGVDFNHFQFKSEKDWEPAKINSPSCELFNLDLKVLSAGLACIPFHTRIGLNMDLSPADVQSSEEMSLKNLDVYTQLRQQDFKTTDTDAKIKTTEENPELEDWLDSVLDS